MTSIISAASYDWKILRDIRYFQVKIESLWRDRELVPVYWVTLLETVSELNEHPIPQSKEVV